MISNWLEEATEGLAHNDRQHIVQELQCHYADAVLHYQELGHSFEEAQQMAVSDLGEAAEANQQFRASHYTPQEKLLLSWWDSSGFIKADDSRPVQLAKWLFGAALSLGIMQLLYMFFIEGHFPVRFGGDLLWAQDLWLVVLLLISPIPWQNLFGKPQSFLISQGLAALWVATTPWIWFEGALWAILVFLPLLAGSYGLFAPVIHKSLRMVRA